jgi:hypothetical protein
MFATDDVEDFQRLKIFTLTGDDGTEFQFSKPVQCKDSLDGWLTQLLDMSRATVRDAISAAMASADGAQFYDWTIGHHTCAVAAALNVIFTRELNEALIINDASLCACQAVERRYTGRIDDLSPPDGKARSRASVERQIQELFTRCRVATDAEVPDASE